MSQRDLVAELRGARPAAPPEVRERVRLIAARATTPPTRRFTWRRALVVAVPAAAAVAAAAVVATRPSQHAADRAVTTTMFSATVQHGAAAAGDARAQAAPAPKELAPLTSPTRVQRVSASLSLRIPTADGVSEAVKRVQRITASLGGFTVSVVAGTHGRDASADFVVKVPRTNVREAIRRYSALGTITSEDVQLQDLEGSLNATERTIARLQRELAVLRRLPSSPAVQRQIDAHVQRIQRLQRQEAATRRSAHYATLDLHLRTPQHAAAPARHGPWHALGVAFRWIGIGAVYTLALGAPLLVLVLVGWLATRLVRRRREEALLSRS